MSKKSNDNGRAFEFIFLETLYKKISEYGIAVNIIKDKSYSDVKKAWDNAESDIKKALEASSKSAAENIFDLEPLILESGDDTLDLKVQPDSMGEFGDVRDILIIRNDIQWEIGLSMKHNHFAVKHSRLAKSLDFGDKWFGIQCSKDYWDDINPIFSMLEREKRKGTKWRELSDKENDVYVPLLQAFIDEVNRNSGHNKDIPRKMVEYLLGKFDFYKIISIDYQQMAQIQVFNMKGTLNKASHSVVPKILVPISLLPTRIVNFDFKPGSNNTVELYMDGGWQFSFRIHNASEQVETSLKFDIQIVGMPTTIITINCLWNK
jgi:hypothetical protein